MPLNALAARTSSRRMRARLRPSTAYVPLSASAVAWTCRSQQQQQQQWWVRPTAAGATPVLGGGWAGASREGAQQAHGPLASRPQLLEWAREWAPSAHGYKKSHRVHAPSTCVALGGRVAPKTWGLQVLTPHSASPHKQRASPAHMAVLSSLPAQSFLFFSFSSPHAPTWHRYIASTRRGSASATARLQAAATAVITCGRNVGGVVVGGRRRLVLGAAARVGRCLRLQPHSGGKSGAVLRRGPGMQVQHSCSALSCRCAPGGQAPSGSRSKPGCRPHPFSAPKGLHAGGPPALRRAHTRPPAAPQPGALQLQPRHPPLAPAVGAPAQQRGSGACTDS